MNIATLKVYGDADALADVRDGLPAEPDSDWKKGDARPDGRVRIDSGFYVNLATDKNPMVLLKQVHGFLVECQARGVSFDASNIEAELRIAYVGDPAPGSPTLDFSLAELSLLIEMGITLSITS
jgi:hypothetical protein